jgi:ATP-binding cassette subfamily B protein
MIVGRANARDLDTPGFTSGVKFLSVLHGNARRAMLPITLVALVAGVLEASALTLFIRGALAITTDDIDEFTLLGFSIGSDTTSLLLAAAACLTLTMIAHVYLARGAARLSLTVLTNARLRLIDSFIEADWEHQSGRREGTLQEAATSLSHRASSAATFLATGGASLTILIALGACAIVVSPLVSIVTILVIIPVVLFLQPLTRVTRRRSHEAVGRTSQFAEEIASTTTLAREIRTFGVGAARATALHEMTRQTSESTVRTRTSNMLASYLFKDLALLAVIGIVGILNVMVDLRASAITAAVFLIIRALAYAQLAYNVVQNGAEEAASIGELKRQIDSLEGAASPDGTVAIDGFAALEFRDVEYAYTSERTALHSINLVLEAGEAIGLIGPSGSGKTTIAELILGMRTPTLGQVLVDGRPLSDIRRADWTRIVSFVPQDPRLSEHTIAENIRFFREGVDDDAVRLAAQQAHIHEAIEALPNGYETVLGPRSTGLSGGQRQRLAIARALAGSPQLLVLDEPTSALDAASEELFRQTLAELSGIVTLVVIAHRPTTLEVCDTIVTIRDGTITRVQRSDEVPTPT